jgi:chemosensory pili system protein ChpA (sensor histidine kinase/response regulator)
MSKEATLEHETLSWVKKELDAVLDQARQALEAYIDNQGDHGLLHQVREPLRQVSGTLQMVELYGAAMLAQEMEEVADALANNAIHNREEAFEVLLRAILQLPDYLEHIQAGNRDLPIVLLPLLNDLRTARDASLLSEKVLFFPDVPEAHFDRAAYGSDAAVDIAALARRLRHIYQVGLLGWFRGQDQRGSLEKLKAVCVKLYEVSHNAAAKRLWWTTAALADALSVGAIDPNVTVKSLLGKVDREIKRLGDRGEEGFASGIPEELSKNILYYVASAEDRSQLIKDVKRAYGLDDLLPQGQALKEARERMAGPNAGVLNTVSEAIREDLALVRDTLELFIGSKDKDLKQLEPAARKLSTVADTLNMLGLNRAAAKILEQTRAIAGMVRGETVASEAALTHVASVMLDVEIAINNFTASRAQEASSAPHDERAESPTSDAVAEAEHRRLLAAVIAEALRDLERTKEAINDFIMAPADIAQLAELPTYLERIKGAIAMAHIDHAPALLASISGYVSGRLLAHRRVPGANELESLADAITSIEFILESCGKGANVPLGILEIGRASVARLGYPVHAPAAGAAEDARAEPSGWTGIDSAFASLATGGQIDQVHAEAQSAPTEMYNGPAPTASAPPAAPTAQQVDAAQNPQNEDAAAPPKPQDAPPSLAALTGEADDEILEIFIEEAEEELATINTLLPKWQQAPDDQEALVTVRRSFHTLKGSGRLVGAQILGEFAWSCENLLNRIIDGTLPAAGHIHEVLAQAPQALAQLIAQIKGQGAPKVDVFALMELAQAMSKPEHRPVQEAEPASSQAAIAADTGVSAGEAAAQEPISITDGDGAPPSDGELTQVWRLDEVSVDWPSADAEPADIPAQEPEQLWPDEVTQIISFPAPGCPGAFEIEEVPLSVDLPFAADSAPTQEEAPAAASADIGHDPVLLEIFINEAVRHLGVLELGLGAATAASSELPVTDDLLRALHTLNGSALTAGVPEIARLCGPLEHYAAARAAVMQSIPENGAALLSQATGAIHGILDRLRSPGRVLPDTTQLHASIESMLQEELARQTAQLSARSIRDSVDVLIKQAEADELSEEAAEAQVDEPSGQSVTEVEAVAELEPPTEDIAEAPEPAAEAAAAESAEEGAAAVPTPAPRPMDEPDRELLDIFLEEARDLMQASDASVQRWQADNGDKDAVSDLQRQLHTLKGGARMAGCAAIGDLSHAVESTIIAVVEARAAPDAALFDAVHLGFDRLNGMLEQVRNQQPVAPAPDVIAMLDGLRHGQVPTVASEPEPPVVATEPATEAPSEDIVRIAIEDQAATTRPPVIQSPPYFESQQRLKPPPTPQAPLAKSGASQESIRVSAELLEHLVNAAGEVNIYHARLEQEITAFRFNLKELEQTVARLRDQLRKLEMETEAQILFRYEQEQGKLDEAFDPLELDRYSTMQQLSRALGESVNDLVSIKEILVDQVRDSETLLLQQSRVSTDLQEGLMRTRMVQFTGMAPRLRRIARQTAAELGKKVELRISGESNELDRSVLDRMVAPLEHMLRNAISHGIEGPGERMAKGKPEAGMVRLSVAREAGEIVVKVEDDGRGVDLEAVQAKARSLGMIGDDDKLSSHDIMQFILEPGFSTASSVTQISGRGVGMDVVSSEIKQLGGTLSIDSTHGRGTSFTVRLPFTLAINQALLVQAGEDIYAVPLTSIEGVVRLSGDELRRKYAEHPAAYEYAGNVYELKHLGSLLGRSGPVLNEIHARYPILLIKAGERRVALQAEGLLGNREVVVKSVGPQISKVRGVSGATILGDGRVVLILDLPSLVRLGTGVQVAYRSEAPRAHAQREGARTIMVVDDSITIRKVTTRMLERNNFTVLTAKDGVDAVGLLHDNVPDLLLLDIEMPRMDGYELATYIRNAEYLHDVPIIMITSRSGEKHRQRAMEIGVDRYLGKPYQETELLGHINDILATRAGTKTAVAGS